MLAQFPNEAHAMSDEQSKQTRAVFDHHVQALGEGLESVLSDYAEDAVLYTPDGPQRGLGEIRAFFEVFMAETLPKLLESFELLRTDIDGEILYVTWSAGDIAPLGTDTFLIRDGKIQIQTFAAYFPDAPGATGHQEDPA